MHKIHFGGRCIIIGGDSTGAVPCHVGEDTTADGLVGMVEDAGEEDTLAIRCDDAEEMYRRICGMFVEVTAGGGLVSNREGEFLMIRRNGLWDLPKGHLEKGEDIGQCSLREVQEETGADALVLRKLICITDHCYMRDGRWHLKHTWWYDMFRDGDAPLVPQTEEDITEAVWIPRQSLGACLTRTYPSIREVFDKAGIR